MIVLAGHFRFPPQNVERARPAMERVIAASLQEARCRAYSYAEDVIEPGLFRVHEEWNDREALQAHFASPHMERWRMEREGLGFFDRSIEAFEKGPAVSL